MTTIDRIEGNWTYGTVDVGTKLFFGVRKEGGEITLVTLSKNLGFPFAGRSITKEGSLHLPANLKKAYNEVVKKLSGFGNTKEELLQRHLPNLDKRIEWDDSERMRSTTYRKVINVIPDKFMEYVDDVHIDGDGIWVWLRQEYDFNDCSGAGTCHADTLKEIKETFRNGIVKHSTEKVNS